MQTGPDYSRVSIRQHSMSRNTDNLYNPMRETLHHPENIQRHAPLMPFVTQSSFVSKQYIILTPEQLQRMEQNVYIPNAELYPTNRLQLVKNEKFFAVDACQRIIGPPITQQQAQMIRQQGIKKQQVVYEFKRQDLPITSINSVHVLRNGRDSSRINAPPLMQQKTVYQRQPRAQQYNIQKFDDYGRTDHQYKYNLFSMIDQPANGCRERQGCTSCPGNSIIPQKNRPLTYRPQ